MITNPQRDRLAEYLYGGRTDTNLVPKTFYIGLSTSQIGAGGEISGEISEKGYTRVSVTNDPTNFGTASDGKVVNRNMIEFPEATDDWGTIQTVFITESGTSTTALYYTYVNRNIPKGATLYFAAGDLALSITN